MISFVISYMISCCKQDCVVVLAPYPNNPHQVESFNIKTDFALQGDGLVWYARPQLFFNCTLCLAGAKGDRRMHKEVSLVYFSTFEPIELTPDSIMQRAGVPMLYDPASNPRLPGPALPLNLPSGQRAWTRSSHSVLHWRKQSPHYSIQLQGL